MFLLTIFSRLSSAPLVAVFDPTTPLDIALNKLKNQVSRILTTIAEQMLRKDCSQNDNTTPLVNQNRFQVASGVLEHSKRYQMISSARYKEKT